MKRIDMNEITVGPEFSIKETMRNIDRSGFGMALIIDKDTTLLGLVTDGDIRRSILNGKFIDEPIRDIMNKNHFVIDKGTSPDMLGLQIKKNDIYGRIPVVDKGKLVDLIMVSNNKQGFLSISKDNIPKEQLIKRVLIIGGGGYIGSVVVKKLLEKNYNVTVLDKLLYGEDALDEIKDHPNFKLIKGDVRHIEKVVEAIQDVNAVIHLAGLVGDPACQISPRETMEQNLLATLAIAQVCKFYQVNRFLFASSCSVYGAGEQVLTEESALNPVSIYARDKILSEKGLLDLMDDNFSPVIMRNATVYGLSPRPRFDLVLNVLTAHAVINNKFKIFGGEQRRPMIHVHDVADAFILALEASLEKVKGQVFNVGSNEQNFKIIDLGKKVKEVIPHAEMIVEETETDARNYHVSFDKIKNVLGFTAKHSIEEGINEIKDALLSSRITDFKDAKFSNYIFLKKDDPFETLIPIHRSIYDSVAAEYNKRWRSYLDHQEDVLAPFVKVLKSKCNGNAKVLDIGCGVGLDLYLLKKAGFEVHGFDLSPEMVKFAKQNVPRAIISVGNFLENPVHQKFHSIVMDAFIHLFPKKEIPRVLNKLKSFLLPGGFAFITTTKSDVSNEGFFAKKDYEDQAKRFRKFWTKNELIETLQKNGFKIVDYYEDHEQGFDKHWMNVIVQKQENE